MFLRASKRLKDGKEHRYWSIVENKRVGGGKVVQRHVLYLGEINDSQREAWRKTIEVFEDGRPHPRTVALFPQERIAPTPEESIVRIRLDGLELHRPRQWGACWLACDLYERLGLDRFWAERLPPSRKGTRWDLILQALCAYRLIDPGSEASGTNRGRGGATQCAIPTSICGFRRRSAHLVPGVDACASRLRHPAGCLRQSVSGPPGPTALPPRHPARPPSGSCSRADPARRPRQVRRHADARCPLPDHRRPHPHPQPLHPARSRPEDPARKTPSPTSRPSPSANHFPWPHRVVTAKRV